MKSRIHDPPEAEAPPGKGGRGASILRETEQIKAWLKRVRFRKTLLGGVSEADVWKKIGELNDLYEAALTAERMRYDALLERQIREVSQKAEEELLRRTAGTDSAGDGGSG